MLDIYDFWNLKFGKKQIIIIIIWLLSFSSLSPIIIHHHYPQIDKPHLVIRSRLVSHKEKEYISFYFSFLVLSLFNLCVVLLAIKHFRSAREFYILKRKGTLFSLHDRNEGWRIFSRTRILRRSQNARKRNKNTGRHCPLVLRGHKHFTNIKPLKTAWRAHIFYFVKEKEIAKFIHHFWNICPNEKRCPHDL